MATWSWEHNRRIPASNRRGYVLENIDKGTFDAATPPAAKAKATKIVKDPKRPTLWTGDWRFLKKSGIYLKTDFQWFGIIFTDGEEIRLSEGVQ